MEYEPLDISTNQIRLPRFLPPESDQRLRGTLKNFSLDGLTPGYMLHLAKTTLNADRSSAKISWHVAWESDAGVTNLYTSEKNKTGSPF